MDQIHLRFFVDFFFKREEQCKNERPGGSVTSGY